MYFLVHINPMLYTNLYRKLYIQNTHKLNLVGGMGLGSFRMIGILFKEDELNLVRFVQVKCI